MNFSRGRSLPTDDRRVMAIVPASRIVREVRFSPEGAAVAFIASEGDRHYVTSANGTLSETDSAQYLAVGPEGETTAYLARDRGKMFVPVNGTHERTFDWASAPVLSADGQSLAHWGMRHDPASKAPGVGSFFVVHDSLEIGPFKDQGHLAFIPKSGGLVYSTQQRGDSFVVVGDQRGPNFDWVKQPSINLPDESIWYWGRTSEAWHLMRSDTLIAKSSRLPSHGGPFFSADGRHFACWICEGDRWSILADDRTFATPGSPVENSSEIAIHSTGDFAYSFIKEGTVQVVNRGSRGASFDAVGPIRFSPDGSRVGYIARSGDQEFAVVDGEKSKGFDIVWPEEYNITNCIENSLVFNNDGSSFAYWARHGDSECVVVNAEEGEPFDALSGVPAFSPTTGCLAYGCFSDRKEYVVVNGIRSDPFDRVWSPATSPMAPMWTPTYVGDGKTLVFGSLIDNKIYLISLTTEP